MGALVPLLRLLGILSGASFIGSYMAQKEPIQPNDVGGLRGWWSSLPNIMKLLAWVSLVALLVCGWNWFKHGKFGLKNHSI